MQFNKIPFIIVKTDLMIMEMINFYTMEILTCENSVEIHTAIGWEWELKCDLNGNLGCYIRV